MCDPQLIVCSQLAGSLSHTARRPRGRWQREALGPPALSGAQDWAAQAELGRCSVEEVQLIARRHHERGPKESAAAAGPAWCDRPVAATGRAIAPWC